MLLGSSGSIVTFGVSLVIGLAYATLAAAVFVRLVAVLCKRCWPAQMFALWPAAGLLLLTLPFEDPRFRLPLIPLFWLIAVSRLRRPAPTCATETEPLK